MCELDPKLIEATKNLPIAFSVYVRLVRKQQSLHV